MRNIWTLWVVAQLALVAALWLQRPAHTTAVITVPVPYVVHDRTMPVESAPTPVPAVVTAPTCPAEVHTVRDPQPAAFPHEYEPFEHVTPALTDARWLAVWNGQAVYASLDGGHTFARVLDGIGTVRDVAFDCFGHVLVVRDNQLGVRDGERERWQPVAWIDAEREYAAALVGGGPDAIVLAPTEHGQMRVAISSDLGASWMFHDLDSYWSEHRTSARQLADGTIRIATTFADCMTDPMHWFVIAHGEVRDEPGDHQAESGPFFARGDITYAGYYWRRRGAPGWAQIAKLPMDNAEEMLAGPVPRVITNGRIYALADGVATELRVAPADVHVLAVDAAGRMWGLHDGALQFVPPR
jgi:hypothetical protein